MPTVYQSSDPEAQIATPLFPDTSEGWMPSYSSLKRFFIFWLLLTISYLSLEPTPNLHLDDPVLVCTLLMEGSMLQECFAQS